jgi:hypothetical protein
LVRRHRTRVGAVIHCPGKEPASRCQVSLLRHQDIDDLAILVDRTIQIDPAPGNLHIDTPRGSVVKRRRFLVSARRLFRGRGCGQGSGIVV